MRYIGAFSQPSIPLYIMRYIGAFSQPSTPLYVVHSIHHTTIYTTVYHEIHWSLFTTIYTTYYYAVHLSQFYVCPPKMSFLQLCMSPNQCHPLRLSDHTVVYTSFLFLHCVSCCTAILFVFV